MFEKKKWSLMQLIWRIFVIVILSIIVIMLIIYIVKTNDKNWKIIIMLCVFLICLILSIGYYYIIENKKMKKIISYLSSMGNLSKYCCKNDINLLRKTEYRIMQKGTSVAFILSKKIDWRIAEVEFKKQCFISLTKTILVIKNNRLKYKILKKLDVFFANVTYDLTIENLFFKNVVLK